ncbi:hypothetical protein [uncultured Erythrobacter sp.]|uniref:hypothetical protein n=1 Tax=uncultured Erythrobacter sp. TaxID=263913 RepID=UPI002613A568|nr:hypothetical protein [uncultured Erythrobacter sp.]
MPAAAFFAQTRLAHAAGLESGAGSAQAGGELLTTFLSSDSLLWGCFAFALMALFTVSRVFLRRREERKVSRTIRIQSRSLHDFLTRVRVQNATGEQGVWHYDFTSGAQQYSDDFKRLVSGVEGEIPPFFEVEAMLERAGIDLVTLARDHVEETEPYEILFSLKKGDTELRPMVLKSCNLRNGEGVVQRMVAVISEAPDDASGDPAKR